MGNNGEKRGRAHIYFFFFLFIHPPPPPFLLSPYYRRGLPYPPSLLFINTPIFIVVKVYPLNSLSSPPTKPPLNPLVNSQSAGSTGENYTI